MKLDLYGWFPPENEETLGRLIKENNIKTVLEIGCFLGKSTKFFVEHGCTVISIDTFEGAKDINASAEVQKRLPTMYEQFKFNLKELGIANKVQIFKGTSEQAFDCFYNGKPFAVDLIFVDGSHEYEDVKKDIEMWSKINSKILCGDDYTDVHPQVKQAVDELLPTANKDQRVWYVIK
jgi:predicted O-methyltransferase YrrM